MWARRNPSAAALAAVGVALALVLLIGAPLYAHSEGLRAAREADLRDRAEQNLRAAEEAVQTMMTRVAEERLEFEPRLEGMRRDLLLRAVRYYDRFLEQAEDDPAMREQAARALGRVGKLRRELGDNGRAEELFGRALRLLDGPGHERQRAVVGMELADLRADAGMYRDVIAALMVLHEKAPDDEVALHLATARGGLAVVLANGGGRAAALGQLTDAAALLRSLTGVAARRELARLLGSLAQLRREAGELEKARPLLDEALATRRALSELTPDDRHEMALTLDRIGDLSRGTKPADAARWHQEAVTLAAALVADYPTVPHHKSLLAQAKNNLGLALLAAGKPGADAQLRDSLAIKQLLADGFPKKVEYRRDLASALVNHAVLVQSRGNAAEAESSFAKGADLYAALKDRVGAARARMNQGTVLQTLGRLPEAEKAYRAALAERGEVAKDAPVEERFEAARTRFLLATLLQMTGKLEESERLHRAALEAYRALPPEPDHVLALCGGLNNLADLLRATKRAEEAIALWDEARAKLGTLAKAQPRPLYAQEEARALHNLGATYTQAGKLKEGLRAHEAALAIRAKLAAAHAREPAYRQELASTYGELGITHGTSNRLDRSQEAFRRAIEIVEALNREYPGQPAILGDELAYQTNLAGLLKATGDEAGWKRCMARVAALKAKLGMK
jgi:tetratricopeptide (TPR) repeat protein